VNCKDKSFEGMSAYDMHRGFAQAVICAAYGYLDAFISAAELENTARKAAEEIAEAAALAADGCREKAEADAGNAAVFAESLSATDAAAVSRHGRMDALKKDGPLTGAVLLCRNNGVLPYYCTRILAGALIAEDEADAQADLVKGYLAYYGPKAAAERYCGFEHEPELLQLTAEHVASLTTGSVEDEARVDLMKRAFALGFYNEKTFRGCGQCTLLAMFELLGRENDLLFQAASAMAGGMGLSGDGVCGGYSGGVMYTGSVMGRRLDKMKLDGDRPALNASHKMAQALRDKFLDTYGSVICADIHREIFGRDYCLRTQAVKNDFDQAGAHTTKCTMVIGMASCWIAGILYDNGYAGRA
jgi:hypothetical protein